MFWIYVLRDPVTGKHYTGSTKNLERRLIEHGIKKPGYTLIYKEAFQTKREAEAREKFLKTGDGRRWLERRLRDLGL
jgi:putative endonuclease